VPCKACSPQSRLVHKKVLGTTSSRRNASSPPRKSFQKALWVRKDGRLAITAYDGSLLLHRFGFWLFDYQSID
jgi:hypothetical protein